MSRVVVFFVANLEVIEGLVCERYHVIWAYFDASSAAVTEAGENWH